MARELRTRKYKIAKEERPHQRNQRHRTSHISKQWEKWQAGPAASRGLQNLGNMCYLISVMQALLHLPAVVNWLEGHKECSIQGCLVCKFRGLGLCYWDAHQNGTAVNSQLWILTYGLARAEAFQGIVWDWEAQYDAEEFLTLFLTALMESNHSEAPTILGLFQHEIVRKAKCPRCASDSKVPEVNNVLGIRLEDDAKLHDVLKTTTFGGNLLENKECGTCGWKEDTIQKATLETCPDVLVLQLTRFNSYGQKNSAKVTFAEHLDLTTFATTTSDKEKTPTTTASDGKKAPIRYRLASVVHHKGDLNFGHYVSVVKNPAGPWRRIDDATVENKVRVGAALRPKDEWTPYLLFYIRETPRHVGAETDLHAKW